MMTESYRHPEVILHEEKHTIEHGSKTLTITLKPAKENTLMEAYVFIQADTTKQRVDQETRQIYTKLKSFLIEKTNEKNLPIEYNFITDDEKLIAWAKTHGNEIFNWDKHLISSYEGDLPDHTFTKTFSPEKNGI